MRKSIDDTMFAYSVAIIVCVALIIIILGAAEYIDAPAKEEERRVYCENVRAWHATGGEFGWPPYKGECE